MKRLPATCESRVEATFGTRYTQRMIPLPINWLATQKLEGTDNVPATFEFRSIATDGGTSHVVWKDVQVAADKLMIFPDPTANPSPGLFIMNVDGSDLRKLALNDSEITSPGSPDWSPDGKQIAFDQFSTSSIYLVNADGTGLKKIGSGVMPTFSPDGKRLAFSGSGMSCHGS